MKRKPTNSQVKAFRRIRRDLDNLFRLDRPDREYKHYRVFPLEGTDVWVVNVVAGVKHDDDTIAAFFRDRVQVFVGPRGGLRGYDSRTHKKVEGWRALYRAWGY